MKNTDVESADELKFDAFVDLLKSMYTRMERENSWPWVKDPENWNKNFRNHSDDLKFDKSETHYHQDY